MEGFSDRTVDGGGIMGRWGWCQLSRAQLAIRRMTIFECRTCGGEPGLLLPWLV